MIKKVTSRPDIKTKLKDIYVEYQKMHRIYLEIEVNEQTKPTIHVNGA